MGAFGGDYFVQIASGATLTLVGAGAEGLRRWAKRTTDTVNGLGGRIDRSIRKVDRRVTRLAIEQQYDRERIVRVETALLFSQSPQEGAQRALEALVRPPAPPPPHDVLDDDLDGDGDELL